MLCKRFQKLTHRIDGGRLFCSELPASAARAEPARHHQQVRGHGEEGDQQAAEAEGEEERIDTTKGAGTKRCRGRREALSANKNALFVFQTLEKISRFHTFRPRHPSVLKTPVHAATALGLSPVNGTAHSSLFLGQVSFILKNLRYYDATRS